MVFSLHPEYRWLLGNHWTPDEIQGEVREGSGNRIRSRIRAVFLVTTCFGNCHVRWFRIYNKQFIDGIYYLFFLFQQAKAVGNGGFNEIMEATLDYNEKPTASSKM